MSHLELLKSCADHDAIQKMSEKVFNYIDVGRHGFIEFNELKNFYRKGYSKLIAQQQSILDFLPQEEFEVQLQIIEN